MTNDQIVQTLLRLARRQLDQRQTFVTWLREKNKCRTHKAGCTCTESCDKEQQAIDEGRAIISELES